MVSISLPELGEGIERATIACYHHKVGDEIEEDQDIVEVVTDKASFNVPTNTSGTITKICFKEGDQVPIGATLCVLEPKVT